MSTKLITMALLFISAGLSFKHGIDALRPPTAVQAQMMETLGISAGFVPYLGVLSLLIGLMLLFPSTYFISNLMNAIIILLIMAFSLRAGNVKTAIIEIPFMAMPLLLIWLKYPFTR